MTFDDSVRYQDSHEWARQEGDVFVVGISDYAQDSLGDVVFVELPEKGKSLSKGDPLGVVESVKAASDIYAPISGEVTEVNEELGDKPELVNQEPFGSGWLVKIKPTDSSEYEKLMEASAYKEYTEGLEE
jgi:glycine cleavage system H protein